MAINFKPLFDYSTNTTVN